MYMLYLQILSEVPRFYAAQFAVSACVSWSSTMSLQIAPYVTLEEVELQLRQLKDVYGLSCEDLEANPALCEENEDAALELSFILEQKKALVQVVQEDAARSTVRNVYAGGHSRRRNLSNDASEDVPLQLAA